MSKLGTDMEDSNVGNLDSRTVKALELKSAQTMEQLLQAFPDVTWAQVFSSVDRLSRSGKVHLQQSSDRDYLTGLRAPFLAQSTLMSPYCGKKGQAGAHGFVKTFWN